MTTTVEVSGKGELAIALIGLDTSHTVAFTQLNQAEGICSRHSGYKMLMRNCMSFPTAFFSYPALAEREQAMRACGVAVSDSFEESVMDCDAVMIEINDPALHREYFERCVALGKPIFLDKPLADTVANGEAILEAAARHGAAFFSASPLRFSREQREAQSQIPHPQQAVVWGPLGQAPAGSSIIWYGVHAFEMLEQAMGTGALGVSCSADDTGCVFHVTYPEGRRGIVILTRGDWRYGGVLRDEKNIVNFTSDGGGCYPLVLEEVAKFFHTGYAPVTVESMREVMNLLEAADQAATTGKFTPIMI